MDEYEDQLIRDRQSHGDAGPKEAEDELSDELD